jgi:hypothetical protein
MDSSVVRTAARAVNKPLLLGTLTRLEIIQRTTSFQAMADAKLKAPTMEFRDIDSKVPRIALILYFTRKLIGSFLPKIEFLL